MSSKIQLILKRLIDVVLSLIGLILLAIPFAIIALVIKLDSKGSVFFRQERSGQYGKPFTIYKFRTMLDLMDAGGKSLPDEERLTIVGRFLRKTGFDELPELWNVIKGDMSLVGPRPLLIKYMPYYREQERKRFVVCPGITGWALVNGRNDLPWDKRFEYDIWYIENWSLTLDLKILLLTLFKVALQKNVQILPTLSMMDLDEERRKHDL